MTGRDLAAADVIIGVAVVAAAVVALFVPRRLASAVSFLVMGVLLAVLWALAGAPDVALAEAAISAGVTGVLLIDTITQVPGPAPDDDARPRRSRRLRWTAGLAATLVTSAALAAALTRALWRASDRGAGSPGLTDEVLDVLPQTGVDHAVTGVLLNLRSLDTLLEVAVLLVAVLAILALRPRPSAGHELPTSPTASAGPDGADVGRAAPGPPTGGTRGRAVVPPMRGAVPPLQTAVTALLVPFLVLLAAWLLFAGSTRTGGAFQAGAVIAAILLLLELAGRGVLPPDRRRSVVVASAGLACFVALAAVGAVSTGTWLELDPAWAGPVIIALEAVLAVSIGACLALAAIGMRTRDDGTSVRGTRAGGTAVVRTPAHGSRGDGTSADGSPPGGPAPTIDEARR